MLTFQQLENRYGPAAAYHWLLEIEKVARIRSYEVVAIDPEIRLAAAFRAQDEMAAA
jgi:hypothetical protein